MNTETDQSDFNYEHLLKEKDAAKVLGTTPSTLKFSRHSGILFGHPAPKHLKMGRSIRYRLASLTSFLDQFQERRNTVT